MKRKYGICTERTLILPYKIKVLSLQNLFFVTQCMGWKLNYCWAVSALNLLACAERLYFEREGGKLEEGYCALSEASMKFKFYEIQNGLD